MLTEDEELRVMLVMTAIKTAGDDLAYRSEGVYWLASKLKEVNDECSQVTEELQKATKLSADLAERLE
jgi:hypothetical protein